MGRDAGGIDYQAILAAAGGPDEFVAAVGAAAIDACRAENPEFLELTQGCATYLFDAAGHLRPDGEDRTVLAWAVTPAAHQPRDTAYQRGYPIPDACAGRALDRGHFIPHSAGGLFGPNMFAQDRALNRGWSREGREFRRLEDSAAAKPGTLYFVRPTYSDASSFPAGLDVGAMRGGSLATGFFRNRFDAASVGAPAGLGVLLPAATSGQFGALGEETAAAWLEEALDAVIVSLGDASMPRDGRRQDLDIIAIVGGELVAFEVKTRYLSALSGQMTRAGNLRAPRLRRPAADGQRQGSQPYMARRLRSYLDIDDSEVEARVLVVDFEAMAIQQFSVDSQGRRPRPIGRPHSCRDHAETALGRILDHRGFL
ncbi:MAG: hypothetical protein LBI84_06680 [Propionibacteriaceae bacterium]|nr:hypothetical protein [Propionibacteriaceae bacterium]